MRVEQFVMAYQVEQDRLRAMLPEGYTSLRPVLRINAELRGDGETAYVEFNTPVAAKGKRGWLNIAHWETPDITYERDGKTVTFHAPFLTLTHTGVGLEGGCPAERDNDGCFFPGETTEFVAAEKIDSNKEFSDCSFQWRFSDTDAHGVSTGETLPAFPTDQEIEYEKRPLTPQNAAAIPCQQVLGSYIVIFDR